MSRKSLSILIPTKRPLSASLPAISKGVKLSSHAQIVISDNSGDKKKSIILEELKEYYGLDLIKPSISTGAPENFRNCLSRAKGDYCLFFADDDDVVPSSLEKIILSLPNSVDHSVAGYTGDYIVVNPRQRFFHRYKDLNHQSELKRTINFLNSGPTNFLFYSIWRRSYLQQSFKILKILPLNFPYRDWIFCFYLLLQGRIVKKDVPFYNYNTLNWINGGGEEIFSNSFRELGISFRLRPLVPLMVGMEGLYLVNYINRRNLHNRTNDIKFSGFYWLKWWAVRFLKRKGDYQAPEPLKSAVLEFVRSDSVCVGESAENCSLSLVETLRQIGGQNISEYCDFFAKRL